MENPTLDVNSGEESGIGSRQECLGFEEDKFPAHCSPKLGFLCGWEASLSLQRKNISWLLSYRRKAFLDIASIFLMTPNRGESRENDKNFIYYKLFKMNEAMMDKSPSNTN